jgi:DNA repair exonuclease SbcCD ATPase subunit
MKIKRLKVRNFLTIGNPQIELELDSKGMVLITGDNRDDTSAVSNGAGKSTIGDAICWALFGETARSDTPGGPGKTGDDVVNNIIGKNCFVEVILEDDGIEFAVTRFRKHKQGKNSLNVTNETQSLDLTKGTDRLTQELVTQIVGCSLEVFRSAIYAAQDSIPNLPGMTDKNLKEIVEESAGINRLAAAYAIAREDLKVVNYSLSQLQSQLDQVEYDLRNVSEDLESNKKLDGNYEDDIKSQISVIAGELVALSDNKRDLQNAAMPISEEEADAKLALLSEELDKYVAHKKKADTELSKLEREYLKVDYKFKEAYAKAKADRERIDEIKNQVGQPCGECGKPYCEEDLESVTKIAKKTYIESKRKVDELKVELEAAKKAHSDAAEAVALLGDIPAAVAKNKANSDDIRDKLDVVKDNARKIKSVSEEITRKLASSTDLQKRVNPYKKIVDDLAKKEAELVQKGLEINKKITECKAQSELLAEAVKVFSPAGVRAHVIDTVTPLLNDRTAHYLSILSDGNINATWNTLTKSKSGELKEKFAIEVVNDKGSNTFGGLSGGEKRKVRIATSLALQDLVASRAIKPIELFIADEIDDAIDDAGLERLMMLLEEKAREKGTVLMISHNSLSDWCSSEMVVIKEGGFSRVEGALVV